jgi:hypothetical protein
MKTVSKAKSSKKKSTVKIDPALDKYHNVNLFKEKVEEATSVIKRVGLPKLSPK